MKYKNKKLRHELKYYINYSEYTSLRQRLKLIMAQDPFAVNNGNYHIRSLYFDDIYDSALYDKLNGVSNRQKYRIRIYNKSDAVIRLERKAKYNQYISKESGKMTRIQYEKILKNDSGFLLSLNESIYKDFYLQINTNLLKPKVIVDYEREAYIFNVSDVRITFDKMLSAGVNSVDIFDKNLVTVNTFSTPSIILEIKYNDFLSENIRTLLHLTSSENSAISKYVICRLFKEGGQLI